MAHHIHKKTETYKILMLGDSAVGKTSIITRFTDRKYEPYYITTLGLDFRLKIIHSPTDPNKELKLQIWDTAGQERFKSLSRSYFRSAHAVVLVYAIDDKTSFDHVANWLDELTKHGDTKLVKILVGNKVDVEDKRFITTQEGQEIANKQDMFFEEASAKTGKNIDLIFELVVKELEKQTVKEKEKQDLHNAELKDTHVVVTDQSHASQHTPQHAPIDITAPTPRSSYCCSSTTHT